MRAHAAKLVLGTSLLGACGTPEVSILALVRGTPPAHGPLSDERRRDLEFLKVGGSPELTRAVDSLAVALGDSPKLDKALALLKIAKGKNFSESAFLSILEQAASLVESLPSASPDSAALYEAVALLGSLPVPGAAGAFVARHGSSPVAEALAADGMFLAEVARALQTGVLAEEQARSLIFNWNSLSGRSAPQVIFPAPKVVTPEGGPQEVWNSVPTTPSASGFFTMVEPASGNPCTAAEGSWALDALTGRLRFSPARGWEGSCALGIRYQGGASSARLEHDVLVTALDLVPPAHPLGLVANPSSPANGNAPLLSGSTEPQAVVRLFSDAQCSLPLAGPAIAGTGGEFSVNISVEDDTSTDIFAITVDGAGNASTCSGKLLTFVEDSTPPTFTLSPPSTPLVPAGGASFFDVTYEGSASISLESSHISMITTGNATCTLSVSSMSNVARRVALSACTGNGQVGIALGAATAYDAAGNAALPSGPSVTFTVDGQAPESPAAVTITPPSPANANSPTLQGSSEAGATVRLYSEPACTNSLGSPAVVAEDGTFSVGLSVADDSITDVYAKVADAVGNTSPCSAKLLTYVEDSTAPTVTLGAPSTSITRQAGSVTFSASFAGATALSLGLADVTLATTGGASCDKAMECSGSTSCTITLSACAGNGTVGISLPAGTARDAANNQAAAPAPSVTFTVDNTPPSAPTGVGSTPASPANANSTQITGSVEPLASVRLYSDAGCTTDLGAATTASESGVFISSIPMSDDTSVDIYARVTDAAGNVSDCSNKLFTFEEDSTPPSVTLGSPSATLVRAATSLTFDVSYSGASTILLGAGHVVVTGTTCGKNVSTVNATTRRITLTGCTGNGPATLSLLAGTARDEAGNLSDAAGPSASFTIDNTSPGAPTGVSTTPASPASTSTPTLSGTAEANATVELFSSSDCGSGSLGSTAVNGSGSFSVGVSLPANATTNVYARVTDLAGNVSSCSDVVASYRHDSLPPTGTIQCSPAHAIGRAGTDTYSLTCSGASDPSAPVTYTLTTVSGTCPSLGAGGTASGTFATPATDCVYTVAACDSLGQCTEQSSPFKISSYTLSLTLGAPSLDGGTCSLNLPGSTTFTGSLASLSYSGDTGIAGYPGTANGSGLSVTLDGNTPAGTFTPSYAISQAAVGGAPASTAIQLVANTAGSSSVTKNSTLPTLALPTTSHLVVAGRQAGTCASGAGCRPALKPGAIATGSSSGCALTPSRGVRCWGAGTSGQLGNGSSSSNLYPVQVTGLSTGVAALSAGSAHFCALLDDGSLKCWGNNGSGAVGDGSYLTRLTPVSVNAGGTVSDVQAHSNNTCVVVAGKARCWGSNWKGQVGDGTTTTRTSAVDVCASGTWGGTSCSGDALTGVKQVGVGFDHACALMTDATVRCWGDNANGELGNGSTVSSATPVSPTGVTNVVQVAVSNNSTCALLTSGAVQCWGENYYGQLANGTWGSSSSTAVSVNGLSNAIAISGRASTYCALVTDGTVKCWGRDLEGLAGSSTYAERVMSATTAAGVSGAVALSVNDTHSCALLDSGEVTCWGAGFGVGNPTPLLASEAPTLAGLSGVTYIAGDGSSEFHCAIASGALKCWGRNQFGGLGDGTNTSRTSPTQVSGLATGVTAVAANNITTCAVVSGAAKCWGQGSWGQMGDGTTTAYNYGPVAVPSLASGVADIDVGRYNVCALTSAGQLKCWGSNEYGRLGTGAATTRVTTPEDVDAGLTYSQFALGGSHGCGVLTTGGVRCWGSNGSGQLGDGTTTDRTTPVDVSGLSTGVASVAASESSTCAILTTGAVKCWGGNSYGALGLGTTSGTFTTPTATLLTTGVQKISSSSTGRSCALLTGGKVSCWGANDKAILGDGSLSSTGTPVQILATGAVDIAVNDLSTCVALDDATVKCWGQPNSGMLGRIVSPLSVLTSWGGTSFAARIGTCDVLTVP